MRYIVLMVLGLALAACSPSKDLPAADHAVAQFHQQLDAGQFQAIYDQSDSAMKAAAPAPKLIALLDAVHRKLGTVKSSARQGWNDTVNMQGHFLTTGYKTSFVKGDGVETFVFRVSGKQAALVGYNINSDALIVN
jgi:hypothetical protein